MIVTCNRTNFLHSRLLIDKYVYMFFSGKLLYEIIAQTVEYSKLTFFIQKKTEQIGAYTAMVYPGV